MAPFFFPDPFVYNISGAARLSAHTAVPAPLFSTHCAAPARETLTMTIDKPRPRVLVCGALAPEGLALLRAFADVDVLPQVDERGLVSAIVGYDGLIVDEATTVSATVAERSRQLKIIGTTAATLNHIDVDAVRHQEIVVLNSHDPFTVAVAEHTLALLLALARRLPHARENLLSGGWQDGALPGTGLAGKTLGIVGFGRIGRQVAHRAQAFGMRILVNQIRQTPELTLEEGLHSVDLDRLLVESDFITLHVPQRDETYHLLGPDQLRRMKRGAFLVNTAAADIVDQEALLAQLNSGDLAGVAMDLVAPPQPGDPLAFHERVLATPRVSAQTAEAHRAASISIAEQIIDFLRDVELDYVLPLRVVALDRVIPHESIDPRRVERLAMRIEQEGRLSNPPIVTAVGDNYMVLDGATRTSAMKMLGYPHAIVQLSSTETGLGLQSWYHVIMDIDSARLLQLLEDLPNITMVPASKEKAREDLFEYGALCYFHFVDEGVFLVQAASGVNRLDALNAVTEAYIAAGLVERTLETNMTTLRGEFPTMTALVVFPEYTVTQVMQVTLSGRYFPAGITRFIIPGRVLRLNADLAFLKSDRSLREKNRWLRDLLLDKLNKNQIRFYAEPVYLLDE